MNSFCGAAGGARESSQGAAADFRFEKLRPRARAFWTIRPRCAFLWCAHRPAAPLSTRTHQSRCSPVLEPTRRRHVDDVLVLALRRDVRAHARRTLPLHAEGAAARGAASGGERRSHGAARSIAAPQAARGRAQAPPSGRSRARCFARGASPPADRRSCALRCTRTCAGEAAARRGWPPLWWVLSCAMYGAARHPCVENMREVWSRGVVVSLRDFYFACYNI